MMLLRRLLYAVVLSLLAAGSAHGQTPTLGKPAPSQDVTIPEHLTREGVHKLLSEIDDTQARELLLKRLTEEADRNAAGDAMTGMSLAESARENARALIRFIADAVSKVDDIPSGIAKAWANFTRARGARDIAWLWGGLLLSLMAGVAAVLLTRRPASAFRDYAENAKAQGPVGELALIGLWIIANLLPVVAFVAGAGIVNLALNASAAPDARLIWRITIALAASGLIVTLARIALTPTLTSWRRCDVARGATDFLVWRIGLVALIFNVGFGLTHWLAAHGSPFRETWIGFWVNLVVHALLIATIWQGRRGIAAIVAGSDELAHRPEGRLAQWWPAVMILGLIIHWLVVEIIVATRDINVGLVFSMAVTLAVLTALPVINHAIRAATELLVPIRDNLSPALAAAERTTQAGVIRIVRVVIVTLVVIGLLKLWNVNVMSMAQQSMGEPVARSGVKILLILGVAYAIWELIHIVVDRQIAAERVALGLDKADETGMVAEGEGGGAGARLGTLLPLVRVGAQIAIAVMTVLAVLDELGVNVVPLLAGAGVVGLAIGFGAQTLVKDIISGIFFLIDDAFRKGEYIDIGTVKGTVEKISLRSMQLRHHNGPLNTIPFGGVSHVTNFSRDWVIMKLSLRLTYDTDAEKVRKMIKKLGQEMAEEEALKPLFLQPLKSQGVIQMEDSAMIMRVKFMTRPGDQWALRRVVFARIRDLFEREGIRFASREVVVRIADHEGERTLSPVMQETVGAAAARSLEADDALEPTRS